MVGDKVEKTVLMGVLKMPGVRDPATGLASLGANRRRSWRVNMFTRRPAPLGSVSIAPVFVPEPPPSVAQGVIYAVGDIHGRADLLNTMLDTIKGRDGDLGVEGLSVILLGDYVDRGPHSKAVLDRLSGLAEEGWCRVVALKGNHEEMMLKFLGGSSIGPEWVKLGGSATMRSYGVTAPLPGAGSAQFDAARQALASATPPAHIAFMENLKLWETNGNFVFVHAGVKPDVPLEEQKEKDLLWIRGEFGRCERPMDKVVVYGHTPGSAPKIEAWKIGLDTGAYGSGVLTSMRLEGATQEIVQATRGF